MMHLYSALLCIVYHVGGLSSTTTSVQHLSRGVERTFQLVRQRCYWPSMSADIARWCQECERCQRAKGVPSAPGSFMGHLLAAWSNEILALDFTVLEPSRSSLENVLVMTDIFTKYTLAVPTRDQRAETSSGSCGRVVL